MGLEPKVRTRLLAESRYRRLHVSLEQELRDGAAWLIQLADDLKAGRAKEVLAPGHVFQHLLEPKSAEPMKSPVSGEMIAMQSRELHVDLLELWGTWVYIATCPRTGIRFVEGRKK